jgi:hypothetical protein
MGDAEHIESDEMPMSREQLDALARLLAWKMSCTSIEKLAVTMLGPEALHKAANEVNDLERYTRIIVQELYDHGRIPDVMTYLNQAGNVNPSLTFGLNRILRGEYPGEGEALQAFVNEYEPFLNSAGILETLPKVLRTVCAVALGPYKGVPGGIVGSGFLIAPDLVMTNYHVVKSFLTIDKDTKEIKAAGPGNQIFFFFDYLWMPAPQVPPNLNHTSLAVTAKDDGWLVYARKLLPYDGMPEAAETVVNEYDYAVIRLARPVGDLPARKGGGVKRGWLDLPGAIDVTVLNQRILVFQHPGTAPQQYDIGDYLHMDRSKTRVWYSVSAARGSSGGAAVDTNGQLFALHNAEVQAAAGTYNGPPRNQGIRIDLIAKDLRAAVPALGGAIGQVADNLNFWSLNDDSANSRPIIGRKEFRKKAIEMIAANGERVLAVTGPVGSGRHFSIELLQRTLGAQMPVVVVSPIELQTLDPRQFLRRLVDGLGVLGTAGKPIPELPSTENVPGWLRLDLPRWLFDRLSEDEQRDKTRYPAWVVIDTVMPPGQSLLWADYLKDFVAALVGVRDPGQAAVDIPQLRWMFLASSTNTLPIGGVVKLEDDLSNDTSYEEDFAECMKLAWFSIDKEAILDDELLKNTANLITTMNAGNQPLREALANGVRRLIKKK